MEIAPRGSAVVILISGPGRDRVLLMIRGMGELLGDYSREDAHLSIPLVSSFHIIGIGAIVVITLFALWRVRNLQAFHGLNPKFQSTTTRRDREWKLSLSRMSSSFAARL